ncbi:MAG: lysophospholipid acyltransferase family protein [Candidatus Omnitrophica bacterium]|nr:lysophospholipid acyltransferase family protein [Candidatus Omnitrophota bacterium]
MNYIDYLIYRFAYFLGFCLPIRICYFISRRISEFRYYTAFVWRKSVKKNITENLRIVLQYKSEKEGKPFTIRDLRKIVKQNYYHFAQYMTDFLSMPKNRRYFFKKLRVIGIENVEKALTYKKGVIILTAHLGNWELAGAMSTSLGFPLSAIALPYKSKNIANFFTEIRKKTGINVIKTGTGPKEILKALRKNEIVAVLGDRVFTEKGTKIDFMGKTAILPRGPATLAVKTGAKYVAGFLFYNRDSYTLLFQNLNEPSFNISDVEKINFYLDETKKILEKYILQYTYQWLNFSNTWNTEN